jgi:cyclic-di-GMP phosphodiesterase TipF (flagellum assembly factor)
MRFLGEHPFLVGLPIAAGVAALAQLEWRFGVPLASLSGATTLLFFLVLGARVMRGRDRFDHGKRMGAIAKRLDALDSALTAVQAEVQSHVLSYETKADQRNQRLVREMKMIETLVAQLARSSQPVTKPEPAAPAPAETALEREPVARPIENLSETELLEVIQSALEDNRIDLYLQPIVSLPQRRVKHYEGLARLRSLDGEVIEPAQYERLAIAQGFMPIIDNLLLFRCVQIVRRLAAKSARRGVFCRISPHSLIDHDFFPQFLDFMRENAALKDLLVFELARGTLDLAGTKGEVNLEALGGLGFAFALGASEDLKLDLAWLRRRNFRFVRLPAELFLKSQGEPDTQILIDNFMTKLERQGIELIVDGIASEALVLPVLEHDVALGEGLLFGGPRPIRRDLLDEADEAGARAHRQGDA